MNEVKATMTKIILLALIVPGTVAAKDASAAERSISGVSPGAGLHSNHIAGFDRGIFDRAPAPPPVFNPSYPNTVPQSPEKPVSPASPGSVFGDD